MLATLVRFSIRFYGIVIALAVLILLYGSYRFTTAGLDIFPEFASKRVIIQTEALGLSSEQVEVLVTRQIEMSISGLAGLESVRSESIQGLSIVTATFIENSDVYRNRQLISERLAGLGITPVAILLSSSSATVLTIGLSQGRAHIFVPDISMLGYGNDYRLVHRYIFEPYQKPCGRGNILSILRLIANRINPISPRTGENHAICQRTLPTSKPVTAIGKITPGRIITG